MNIVISHTPSLVQGLFTKSGENIFVVARISMRIVVESKAKYFGK